MAFLEVNLRWCGEVMDVIANAGRVPNLNFK
jgi:hypothetical protein